MPITYEVDQTNNLICAKATGSFTDEDVRQFESVILSEYSAKQGCSILFDATASTTEKLSERAVKRLLGMGTATPSSDELLASKTAIVSPNTRCSAWIHAFVRGTRRVIVFMSVEVAEAWLGLKPDRERALQPSLKENFLSKPNPVVTA